MPTNYGDEVECIEKLEELNQLLGHLRALKKDGQQDNIDWKINAVEKTIDKYFKIIGNQT